MGKTPDNLNPGSVPGYASGTYQDNPDAVDEVAVEMVTVEEVYPGGTANTAPSYGNADYSTGYAAGTSGEISEDSDTDEDLEAKRAEIEQTRAEMGQTIDAIQAKLSPETLTQQAKDAVRGATIGKVEQAVNNAGDMVQGAVNEVENTVGDAGSSIVETIRQNPIPAALAGIGLGWLFVSMRKGNSHQAQYRSYGSYQRPRYANDTFSRYGYAPSYGQRGYAPEQYRYGGGGYQTSAGYQTNYQGGGYQSSSQGQDMSDQAQNAVNQAQDMAGQAVNQAQDMAGQAVNQAQDMAGQAVNQVQDVAGQAMDQAQYTAQQAMSGFQRMMHTNPLAVGAMALATGAAIGLALPETQLEDQWMGDARDSFMSQAQETAQQTLQKVEGAAQQGMDAAQQAMQQQSSGSSSSGQSSGGTPSQSSQSTSKSSTSPSATSKTSNTETSSSQSSTPSSSTGKSGSGQ